MAVTMTDRERFPDYFVERNIDRRQCHRVVPMKVLVIGMLRTGTLSYPDAKVIVIQRDPEQWFDSCYRTVIRFASLPQLKVLYFLDRWLVMRFAPLMDCLFTSLFGPAEKDPVKMRANWIRGYLDAYDEVRRIVPPEQRLEFNLNQGWEPICKFLGHEVPNKPFPHVNDSASFDAGIKVLIKRMWIRAAKQNLPFILGTVAVAMGWWMYG
ncbi:MAG: hypothetical protein Q9182_006945 [Xanthomendoza sp. 2 TL-2023]